MHPRQQALLDLHRDDREDRPCRKAEQERQGTALGIFGSANVGAAVTNFVAPFIMVAYGWKAVAQVWGMGLAVMAIVFWLAVKPAHDLVPKSLQPPPSRGQAFSGSCVKHADRGQSTNNQSTNNQNNQSTNNQSTNANATGVPNMAKTNIALIQFIFSRFSCRNETGIFPAI